MGRMMWLKDLTIQEALAIQAQLDTAFGYPNGLVQHYTAYQIPQTAGLLALVVDGRAFAMPLEEDCWDLLTQAQRDALIAILPDGWIDDSMDKYA